MIDVVYWLWLERGWPGGTLGPKIPVSQNKFNTIQNCQDHLFSKGLRNLKGSNHINQEYHQPRQGMHTNKAGKGRHFRDSKTLCTPLSGQFDINGVRLFPIAAQYCHLTRELQVDKLDRKWRVQYFVLALIIKIEDCICEAVCVLRWRLVYPSLRPAACFSSLAVTAGQCVGYNQMEEWSEHNKYDWYSPAQAWPHSYTAHHSEV